MACPTTINTVEEIWDEKIVFDTGISRHNIIDYYNLDEISKININSYLTSEELRFIKNNKYYVEASQTIDFVRAGKDYSYFSKEIFQIDSEIGKKFSNINHSSQDIGNEIIKVKEKLSHTIDLEKKKELMNLIDCLYKVEEPRSTLMLSFQKSYPILKDGNKYNGKHLITIKKSGGGDYNINFGDAKGSEIFTSDFPNQPYVCKNNNSFYSNKILISTKTMNVLEAHGYIKNNEWVLQNYNKTNGMPITLQEVFDDLLEQNIRSDVVLCCQFGGEGNINLLKASPENAPIQAVGGSPSSPGAVINNMDSHRSPLTAIYIPKRFHKDIPDGTVIGKDIRIILEGINDNINGRKITNVRDIPDKTFIKKDGKFVEENDDFGITIHENDDFKIDLHEKKDDHIEITEEDFIDNDPNHIEIKEEDFN